MLCFRCEHRARALETGIGPRAECKDLELSKTSCYMFTPCFPIITEPLDKDDIRPRGPSILSRREKAVSLMETDTIELKNIIDDEDKICLVWDLKEEK